MPSRAQPRDPWDKTQLDDDAQFVDAPDAPEAETQG